MNFLLSKFSVDFVLGLWQRVPAPVLHNLEKARVLKKIFWHLNVDGIDGCYMEFGVAHGHSIRAAEIAIKTTSSKSLGIKKVHRLIFGFDTFESFESNSPLDRHVTWEGSAFSVPFEKVKSRFKKSSNITLFKVNAVSLVSAGIPIVVQGVPHGIKASVILFDMDLYSPTKSALTWSKQYLQKGTFLIFDEYFSFGGDFEKGEARALHEFLNENPEISIRDYSSYGSGGKIFIVNMPN